MGGIPSLFLGHPGRLVPSESVSRTTFQAMLKHLKAGQIKIDALLWREYQVGWENYGMGWETTARSGKPHHGWESTSCAGKSQARGDGTA